MVSEPGKLQFELAVLVSDEHDDKGTVLRYVAAFLSQSKSFLIEFQGFVEISDIVVLVDHFELHDVLSLYDLPVRF